MFMPALRILGYQGQLSEDILRLLGEKAKATSDLMVRLLGNGVTQLGRGCIQGSPQVLLTGNQGSVKQLDGATCQYHSSRDGEGQNRSEVSRKS